MDSTLYVILGLGYGENYLQMLDHLLKADISLLVDDGCKGCSLVMIHNLTILICTNFFLLATTTQLFNY